LGKVVQLEEDSSASPRLTTSNPLDKYLASLRDTRALISQGGGKLGAGVDARSLKVLDQFANFFLQQLVHRAAKGHAAATRKRKPTSKEFSFFCCAAASRALF
jgi:hypothetical protein